MRSLSALVKNLNIGYVALMQNVIKMLQELNYKSVGVGNTLKDSGGNKHVQIAGNIKGDYVSLYSFMDPGHKLKNPKALADAIADKLGTKVEESLSKDYIIDYQRQLKVTIIVRNEDDWTPTIIIFGSKQLVDSIDKMLDARVI